MSSPGGQRVAAAPSETEPERAVRGSLPSLPPSLNFACARGAPGEVRGSPPRSAGITWCWGREGGAAPQPSLLLQFLPVSALNSGEAGARRGAGLGGLRRRSRGAAPQRRRRASGTRARRLCCIPASDAPSRLHASPAAAAPGGCGSSSSLQLSGDCAWRQVRAPLRSPSPELAASVPS